MYLFNLMDEIKLQTDIQTYTDTHKNNSTNILEVHTTKAALSFLKCKHISFSISYTPETLAVIFLPSDYAILMTHKFHF